MRRIGRLVVAVALTGAVLVGAAGPADAYTHKTKIVHARQAFAVWTTCPEWQVGLACVDTVIQAQTGAYTDDHEQLPPLWINVFRFWYTIEQMPDGELWGRPTKESFGGTEVGQVVVDSRLGWATLETTIPMRTCVFVSGIRVCNPTTSTAQASWTATGDRDRERLREWWRTHDAYGLETGLSFGRAATATAVIDGLPVEGTNTSGALTRMHYLDLRVYKYPLPE